MGKLEEIQREIEILKLELERERLKIEIKKTKEKVIEREAVVSREAERYEDEFVYNGIKFMKVDDKNYKVFGNAGKYDIRENKGGDHYYCNCPDMKYHGFHLNKPCKHIKAFARHFGMHMDGFRAVNGEQV